LDKGTETGRHRSTRRDVGIQQIDCLRCPILLNQLVDDCHRHLISIYGTALQMITDNTVVVRFEDSARRDFALDGESPVVVFRRAGGVLALPVIDIAIVGE
jgi:hypothetical protein